MDLEREIELRRKEIHSDRLSMSIGELESLYERGEIDIHPKFQRVLRWTDNQKARLIESLLLRIPMPPIFVAQDEGGKWDVVDGVQRLGTCFEFLGILKDPEGNRKPPLILSETVLLTQMAGHSFEERDDMPDASFSPSLQRDFRRLRIDINIILKESDPSAKYELFERLNTGGAIASSQEVRNCVLVWMDESLYDWMKDLSKLAAFAETTPVSDRLESEGYRDELALRVLTLGDESEAGLSTFVDINAYLNDKNRKLLVTLPKLKRAPARARFEATFSLIRDAAGEDGFRRYDRAKGAFSGPFVISAFEAVALGVWHNQPKWAQKKGSAQRLLALIKDLWGKAEFTGAIGIGKSAKSRIPKTVPFGRAFFVP
jgi:Protein of unknown function DUF262